MSSVRSHTTCFVSKSQYFEVHPMPSLTCLSCQVFFADGDLQRAHFKTDWHRYNLKRKVAELPSVTELQFSERVICKWESRYFSSFCSSAKRFGDSWYQSSLYCVPKVLRLRQRLHQPPFLQKAYSVLIEAPTDLSTRSCYSWSGGYGGARFTLRGQ